MNFFANNPVLSALLGLMPLFGLYRLFTRWRDRRRTDLPLGAGLNDDWIRRELRAGRRTRAIQGWRALHGGSAGDARDAIDALEAELGGKRA
jgi:hypothetical protein